jgi:hypothetical protein
MLLDYAERAAEVTCADCGRVSVHWKRCVDLHTRSELAVCLNCLPAFLQRQQLPPGCCE